MTALSRSTRNGSIPFLLQCGHSHPRDQHGTLGSLTGAGRRVWELGGGGEGRVLSEGTGQAYQRSDQSLQEAKPIGDQIRAEAGSQPQLSASWKIPPLGRPCLPSAQLLPSPVPSLLA